MPGRSTDGSGGAGSFRCPCSNPTAHCSRKGADLTAIILDYGTTGAVNGKTDLNGDGLVDDADLTIVILNFGREGDQ